MDGTFFPNDSSEIGTVGSLLLTHRVSTHRLTGRVWPDLNVAIDIIDEVKDLPPCSEMANLIEAEKLQLALNLLNHHKEYFEDFTQVGSSELDQAIQILDEY